MRRQGAWRDARERGTSDMKSLLKFITCGSVDDGKSTLIGHMLYDAKLIFADQEKALELESKMGSREGKIDYSLLLDGLMAEREQGITNLTLTASHLAVKLQGTFLIRKKQLGIIQHMPDKGRLPVIYTSTSNNFQQSILHF